MNSCENCHEPMKNTVIIFILTTSILASCRKEEKISQNAVRMQAFVKDISDYARSVNPDFMIIPQNGAELAFTDTDPNEGILSPYIQAINGIGIEELFYDGNLSIHDENLSMLRKLNTSVKIMVSDYVTDQANLSDAIQRSKNEGFISFPRTADNYDYQFIPTSITDENPNNINALEDAKNYLYLISTDRFANRETMLSAIAATNYDVILMDLFFEGDAFTAAEIQQLKLKANGGKRLVISYISIGSAENYRYYWQSGWKQGNPSWIRKKYEGYDDEYWVEFWHSDWQKIIFGNDQSYIKKIMDVGFDGAYLDNVEAYYFLEK